MLGLLTVTGTGRCRTEKYPDGSGELSLNLQHVGTVAEVAQRRGLAVLGFFVESTRT